MGSTKAVGGYNFYPGFDEEMDYGIRSSFLFQHITDQLFEVFYAINERGSQEVYADLQGRSYQVPTATKGSHKFVDGKIVQ